MNSKIIHKKIKDKDIFIFKDHHFALYPWLNLRCKLNKPLNLLSLDHHTDIHEPFLNKCFINNEYDKILAKKYINNIDINNESSLDIVIDKLRNDEHIKTAIDANIINTAFIISYDNHVDKPISYEEDKQVKNWKDIHFYDLMGKVHPLKNISRPYTYPYDKIYIPKAKMSDRIVSDVELYDMALEDEFLKDKLKVFSEMSPKQIDLNGFKDDYILDIDLDYFHTIKSIDPKESTLIKKIMNDARIITIAQEPICVDIVKLDKEVNSKYLEEQLLNFIEKALS